MVKKEPFNEHDRKPINYSQENVYTLLGKVLEAKKSYIQEGNHNPSKEELARRVGITVEKLGKLLYSTRMPVSMQQTVWADQDTTYQVDSVAVNSLASDRLLSH